MKNILLYFTLLVGCIGFTMAANSLSTDPVLVTNYDGRPAALFSVSDSGGLKYLKYDSSSSSWLNDWIDLDSSPNGEFVQNLSIIKNSSGVLRGAISFNNSGKSEIYAYEPIIKLLAKNAILKYDSGVG